jgi:two-component system phosphate regulon sensor histidine kinase PhoR
MRAESLSMKEASIKPSPTAIWTGSILALILITLVSLIAGFSAGSDRGWAMMVTGLLGLLAYHLHNLGRVTQWAAGSEKAPTLPDEPWLWRSAFAGLNRRALHAREQRERLTETLERFRAASQAMPDGVIYLSEHDAIEWLNQRAELHFGLDHTRDIGVSLIGLARHAELARYLAEAERQEGPLMLQSPRRPGIRLLVQAVPFGNGQKMVISRDVTQIERLETMRQDFIANVSHELRTPLTVVGGFLETVMDGLDDLDREDVQRYLGLALDQSSRMQRLIEDLLALSALETGAPAPTEEQVDALGLVEQVCEEARLLSSGRHEISLEVDERDRGDVLVGSEKELHSAFANLASNAVRYTPPGGHVRLGWRRTTHGAQFWVEDDGIGIDPAHIPRLTERFFRADRGRSRETGGTGLGLAIVKHIVSRHQAELRIESALGKGSRFSVQLPLARLRRRPR